MKHKLVRGLLVMVLASSFLLSSCKSKDTNESLPPSPTATPAKVPAPTDTPTADNKLPLQILELARQGNVMNNEFVAGINSIYEVEQKWGSPDKVDQAGSGQYATYDKHLMTFGYNNTRQLFDIRSYEQELKKLTLPLIVQALGEADKKIDNGNEFIYIYQATKDIQLKFVIPQATGKVDHISVVNTTADTDYFLDIVGKSNQLKSSQLTSMTSWRKQIASFAKLHKDRVFLNGPNQKRVALTFDDGPDDRNTSAIIDILKQSKVKGSFFFIGSEVRRFPDVVKKAYENGNLVLNHSFQHDDLTKLSGDAVQQDLKKTEDEIAKIIGKKPAILRTPYGSTNDKVLQAAQKQGYSIVLWSIDTLDWSQKESSNILKNVLDNVRNGDIILMHSNADRGETVKALPRLIDELQKNQFAIVDLETLLGINAYK
jgi:peptidoglycan-N-acetylglucosamine deacetylase